MSETDMPQEDQTENSVSKPEESANESVDFEAKYKEAEEKYIRAYADFENTKKRLEKEKQAAIDYTNEKFAKELLPVIDSLELAVTHSNDGVDLEKLKEGISLTLDTLLKTFERNGVKQVESTGEFDPSVHEAIMQSPSDEHEDGHVVATLQKGYVFKDRVLRPALVNVCKKN